MSELDGKVALITSATQAMGEAIARRLASDGATVVGVGRSEQRGRAVAGRLAADGFRAEFIATDVGQEEQVAHAVDTAVRRFGGLDIVVNNAASLDASTPESPVHLEPTEVFDSIMKVNLYGPFWFVKYAVPPMIEGGRVSQQLVENNAAAAEHSRTATPMAYPAHGGG
jgi:NAD(P)-dependent dehydrogenase (short-subunit alcohol dehydrogenase family)